MKQILKRSLSVFLAITIIFSSAYVGLGEVDLSGIFVFEAKAARESDLTFELNEDGKSYSVIDCDQSAEGEVVIPSTFNDLPVDNISDWTFGNCEIITAISIPDSIKTIGLKVFSYCTSLVSINVDSNNLNYSSIDGILFSKDNGILLQYPSGKIETTYTIPDFVTEIGNEAFFECSNLISIEIPISVTAIGYGAFCGCSNLKSLQIPNSVTKIESGTFYGCSNLERFVISNSVTSIGNQVFELCTNLSSIIIGNNVKSIGWNAFMWCEKLESVFIPDSVESIGDYAFRNCTNLISIVIPDSVINLGGGVFYNCNNLSSVTIGAGVLDIGDYAFYHCNSLAFITIGDNVKSIGDYAFYDCTSLSTITIPDSVISIGGYAFRNCTNLTSVYITDVVAWCNINFSDYSSTPLYYAKNLYLNGKLVTDVVIPGSVTSIGRYSFYNCKNLSTVTIPEGVVTIGERAFQGCDSLNNVTIPDSVKTIGACAFSSCDNLESVVVGLGVENIGGGAFYIGIDNKYLYIFYKGTKEQWGKIKTGSEYVDLCKMHYETTDHTSSELIIKNATVYKSGYQYKECTQCGKILEKDVFPQLKCDKAKLSKISNATSGVKITWGKVTGADSYIIYRKTKGGSWKYLDSTSKTYFTDKTAKSGTTYYYAIKVRNEAGNTDYSNSLSIKRLSNPKLSKASNTSSGVKVTWKKVTGASGYIVYRKTKSGDWKEIGKTSKLYFTDKKAKSGTNYYYTVRAYSGSVKSYYDTDGLSIRRLVAPKISSATSKNEGILLKWNKITGASGYYVYRKASSGEWKKIASVKGKTKVKYLDESPRKGATYQYRVKAYYSKSTSGNSNSYKIKCKY